MNKKSKFEFFESHPAKGTLKDIDPQNTTTSNLTIQHQSNNTNDLNERNRMK
jgi:cellulose biosynthesis protein BcsQ